MRQVFYRDRLERGSVTNNAVYYSVDREVGTISTDIQTIDGAHMSTVYPLDAASFRWSTTNTEELI